MANSIREQALAVVATRLSQVTGISGRSYRARTTPLDRAKLPCILVMPMEEQAVSEHMPRVNWSMLVRFTIIGRGDAPDTALDAILNDAYARLMADRTLGGKVQDIEPIKHQWGFAEGDGGNCVIQCDIALKYQTTNTSMES